MNLCQYLQAGGVQFNFVDLSGSLLSEEILRQDDFEDGVVVFGLSQVAWVASMVRVPDTTIQHLVGMRAPSGTSASAVRRKVKERLDVSLLAASPENGISILTFLRLVSDPEKYLCKESLQNAFMVRCSDQVDRSHVFRAVWRPPAEKFFFYHLPKGGAEFGDGTMLILPGAA